MSVAKPKILIVDDREENLLVLEGLLRHLQAELLEARSGDEALDLLLRHEVALALVDVQMPGMDGFELAELMRSSVRTREIPLIFITAGMHDQLRVFRGYEAGAVDFLVKPLEPRILCSKVTVFLELYRQRQQLTERVSQLEEALAERDRYQGMLKKKNEELAAADRQKDWFLAMLSHELRNPLAPIKNALYILERAAAGSKQERVARRVIDRQVDQLVRLVDDLLNVTRLTRDKITLHKERLELNALVQEAVEDQRALFERQQVRLELILAPEPLWLDGDRARLAQVIANLLQNAAKFTGSDGSATISVRTGSARRAVICLQDSGVGMAPETLDGLFQPFMQAECSLDRTRGGLGLGLALVKGLVEMHGGEVSAHSEGLGQGAKFLVHLPLASAAACSLH